jgi:tRNA (guanine37-N1)-methyltransferase
MRIDILTLFPDMFVPLRMSIMQRAADKGVVDILTHQLRQWGFDRHGNVDDSPYGGGPGMVMRVDVADRAIETLKSSVNSPKQTTRTILPTADGKPFTQKHAERLSKYDRLIFLCPHYEGVDERIRSLVDEELSIGDYVVTGGELPAMVMVDAIVRLLPGTLGKEESKKEESFSKVDIPPDLRRTYRLSLNAYRLLEYPHYTRPEEYRGKRVPKVLLSGHHGEVAKWRREEALKRTKKRRPELL